MRSPNHAERLHRKQVLQKGRVQRRMQSKREVIRMALERTRGAHEKVAQDEVGRLGTVQEMFRKSTDFLSRIIATFG